MATRFRSGWPSATRRAIASLQFSGIVKEVGERAVVVGFVAEEDRVSFRGLAGFDAVAAEAVDARALEQGQQRMTLLDRRRVVESDPTGGADQAIGAGDANQIRGSQTLEIGEDIGGPLELPPIEHLIIVEDLEIGTGQAGRQPSDAFAGSPSKRE